MPRTLVLFLVIFFNSTYFISYVYSARILGLFPHPGKSHQMVFDPLLKRLAERGHDLTVVTFFPLENRPNNYKEVNLQRLADLRLETFHAGSIEFPSLLYRIPIVGSLLTQYEEHVGLGYSAMNICKKLVKFEPLNVALKSEYDVVITESFTSKCVLGLLDNYGIKAPVIGMSSCALLPGEASRMGADDNPSYVPIVTSPFTHNMSFLERLENMIAHILVKKHYQDLHKKEQAIIEEHFGRKITDIGILAKNMSLVMVNSYHVIDGVYPGVPGIVEVGGIHIEPVLKKMPKYIETFVNESEHGVILMSFGSQLNTTSLSEFKLNMFVDAFSKLKQRVLWKHPDSADGGTLIGNNILRAKWLPQNELLQHTKVKAFICHGGKLGTTEAISAGKPMVVVPIFADQKLNTAAIRAAGVGEVLSFQNLALKDIDLALESVLSERMQERARLVSRMWHDRDRTPLDTAVFWTERVIRWGNLSPLYSEAKYIPFYHRTFLDVIAFLVSLFGIAVFLVIYTHRFTWRRRRINKEKFEPRSSEPSIVSTITVYPSAQLSGRWRERYALETGLEWFERQEEYCPKQLLLKRLRELQHA